MTDKAEELREVIREANECMKDFRALIKQAKAFRELIEEDKKELAELASDLFDERMSEEVKKSMDEFFAMMERKTDEATQAVYDRFDTIGRVLLGKATRNDIELLAHRAHENGELPIIQRIVTKQ